MKKVISVLLIAVMLVSVFAIPAFATVNDSFNVTDDTHLYEMAFQRTFDEGTDYNYDELYYHKNADSEIDWCLIYATTTPGPPALCYTVLPDYVSLQGWYIPFSAKYGLYDAKEEKFYDLQNIENFDKYEGLAEQLVIYDRYAYPIGDANLDRELTIQDATFIQRVLVNLGTFYEKDDLTERFAAGKKLSYICDINRDGVRSILDATAIQRKLAKLD